MDNNDVELTMTREQRDLDEVYPGDELQDHYQAYKPAARRQNWFCILGAAVLVILMGAAFFGAKVYMTPNAELETSGSEEGTVINNADNAQVSDAIREHSENGQKPHSNSNWQSDKTNHESSEQEETHPNNEDDEEHSHRNKWHDWHSIEVSQSDGVMYEILEVLSHDPESFTEGLTYHDGKLYESVGLNHKSKLLVVNETTGETEETYLMDPKLFAEGLTYCHGKLYQLTYKAKKGFIYDLADMTAEPETFEYKTTTGEGWGFTYDEHKDEFIVSDGSAYLHFWDRKTLQPKRKHQIMRLDGRPATRINELEFWRNRVVANVWYKNVLLIINPVTGLTEKEYDFSTIWEEAGAERNRKAEVFNGISVSNDPDVLYVTGKWWSKMFKVKLLPEIPSE